MTGIRAFRSVLASIVTFVLLGAAPGSPSHGSGIITTLAIDPRTPSTLYAGTCDRGMFKSTDGGASWSVTGLTNIYIFTLAIDPQTPTTLYVGAAPHDCTGAFIGEWYQAAVYKSTDGGTTWTATGLAWATVISLAIDPKTPTTLYAGTYYQGVFKSTDGGATWSGGGPIIVSALAIDPVSPTTVYAASDFVYEEGFAWHGGVFKSTDGGTTWNLTGLTSGGFPTLAIDPLTPTTLYVGGLSSEGKGVLRSTDGGATWSPTGLKNSLLVGVLAIDPRTTTTLYAGTGGVPYSGVLKSMDGGATWSEVNAGLTDVVLASGFFPNVPALAIEPLTPTTDPDRPLSLYAGTEIGVFKSTDGGATWIPTGLIHHSPLNSVSLNPTTVIGGSASTGTVTLITAAPADDATITLSSSDPAIAMVPGSVTVAAGTTSATFTVSTASVSASTSVTISGTYGGVTRSAELTVTPSDTEPPATSIVSAVDGNGASVPDAGVTLSKAITVAVTGTDNVAVVGFECRLDGGSFTSCTSPVTYGGLALSTHEFEARAVDRSGNRDGTPALHTWTVDSPPETTITSVDRRGDRITFRFTGTDNASVTGFQCSLDGAVFKPCTSPIAYRNVRRG